MPSWLLRCSRHARSHSGLQCSEHGSPDRRRSPLTGSAQKDSLRSYTDSSCSIRVYRAAGICFIWWRWSSRLPSSRTRLRMFWSRTGFVEQHPTAGHPRASLPGTEWSRRSTATHTDYLGITARCGRARGVPAGRRAISRLPGNTRLQPAYRCATSAAPGRRVPSTGARPA
jgi:hypothetical protein